MVSFVTDKKAEYDQVLAFWRWLKEQREPETQEDWLAIVQSASAASNAAGENNGLLHELLMAGMDYYTKVWRQKHG